jgi:hypothetical protein
MAEVQGFRASPSMLRPGVVAPPNLLLVLMGKATPDPLQQDRPVAGVRLAPFDGPPVILIPVSLGELTDRLLILQLKVRRIRGPGLAHVQRELAALQASFEPLASRVPEPLKHQLAAVNAELWELEDGVRGCERRGAFGADFVAMARSIYRLNDRRAALKRAISDLGGSLLLEEKVYEGG